MQEEGKERRGAVRRRMLKGAIITSADRKTAIPCMVRDTSASGARLRFDTGLTIPDTFLLIIDLDGIEVDCEVVSRRGRDMGVKFTSSTRAVKPRRVQIITALRR
jgi:hypothetical protein